ncbi:MAG TPA: DUF4337 domain-containing protein [Pyrinomonadaceae bacterium]|jgi:hypothetical protein|nr:DUF4337 domain-containing protein [Pyrinomonadaceae bacterium]
MPESDRLKINEAHEYAELVQVEKALAPVSLTMAILAVLVAAISLLGHRAHTEVLLSQTRANFQKADLVGKATQQHADEVLIDLLSALAPTNVAQAAALREKLNRQVEQYAKELETVSVEEGRLESESQHARRKANCLDVAELFCEMALVLCSITLLTRQRAYWFVGILAGALGLVISVGAFLVR